MEIDVIYYLVLSTVMMFAGIYGFLLAATCWPRSSPWN